MIRRQRKLRPVPTNCPFCKEKNEPHFKEVEILSHYLTERGKIIGKARTGLCSKHTRKLSQSIKHGRYLGLLPFVVKP